MQHPLNNFAPLGKFCNILYHLVIEIDIKQEINEHVCPTVQRTFSNILEGGSSKSFSFAPIACSEPTSSD